MNRGDVHWADLGVPVGHEQSLARPVVVVSAQPWLDSNPPVVVIAPLTRTDRGRATQVEVEPGGSGLTATSYIKAEDIRAISPLRLSRRLGRVDEAVMVRLEGILRRLLAL